MRRWGQVTFEYFLLFVIMALLTVIGITSFDKRVRTSLQQSFSTVAHRVAD